MSWYYAVNNERRGPVEDAAFDSLVAAGTVRPETLVWCEGMPNWTPLSTSGYRPGSAFKPGATPIPSPEGGSDVASRPGVEMAVCSESGRVVPRSELVEIDGRLVSAEYKNVVLQRIREGVGSSGSAVDPEVLAQQILARDYHLSASSCISRGWSLIRRNFWLCVGATFLTMLISQAAGMIPLIGFIIVFGPITAGLYWMMLRMHRNEPASIGDAFLGFNRSFGHLVGVGAVIFLAMMACFIPAVIGMVAAIAASQQHPSVSAIVIAVLLGIAGFLAMVYFWVSWVFSFVLIIDRQIEFWPAMKLSRRVVGMHWWQVFGVLFLTALIMAGIMVGALAVFGIGAVIFQAGHLNSGLAVAGGILFGLTFLCLFLAVLPLSYSTVAVAYEDIFGPREVR